MALAAWRRDRERKGDPMRKPDGNIESRRRWRNATVRTLLLAGGLAVATAAGSHGATDADGFARQAAIGGKFEVQSSALAMQHAEDDRVRDFAQRLVTDHTAALEGLERIAAKERIALPQELNPAHREMMAALRDADTGFGCLYVGMQVDAHDRAIALFRAYAGSGGNAALKAYAADTLPTLRDHREAAAELACPAAAD